jgi:glutamate racemase
MNRPIGIFDSGIGGLTVARAVKDLLPQEAIIYFGDVANLPYGEKSIAAIQYYVIQICDLLLQRECKVILMACSTASAVAYDLAKAHVGKRATVLNVIDPLIDHIGSKFKGKALGLIGTHRTVQSGVYEEKTQALEAGIVLKSMATPLLAPMCEESFVQGIKEELIADYLQHAALQEISALILGCTHYMVIKKQIQRFYAAHKLQVEVVDASAIMAKYVQDFLVRHDLLRTERQAADNFITSAETVSFAKAVSFFFGEGAIIECIDSPIG